MGSVSQLKSDRLSHPTSSPSIYSCNLRRSFGVPIKGGLNIISPREFDKEVREKSVVFVLVAKEVVNFF
jgi:hypothetical protein